MNAVRTIRKFSARLTYRKAPFLLVYLSILIIYMWFSPNPYQRTDVMRAAWYLFGMGFGSLIPLVYFEKKQGVPFPYLESRSTFDYCESIVYAVFGVVILIVIANQLARNHMYPYQMSPLNPESWFTIILALRTGIIEESFKVALTNVLGIPAFIIQQRKTKTIWIIFVGTVVVTFWAYIHVLTAGFTFGQFLLAFFIGMVLFTVTLWKRNYLPAILVHAGWNTAVALGYLQLYHIFLM